MRLSIFGATGRTGRLLTQAALAEGHEVVALARTPGKLDIKHERLLVVPGNLQDAASVAEVIAGSAAVLSVLGPTSNRPVFEVSQGMQSILAAMNEHRVRRLVQSVGAGVGDPNDRPTYLDRGIGAMLKLVSGNVYRDMLRVAELIRASELDWTLVRVPMLTDEPASGQVRVGYLGKGVGTRISRGDVATWILQQANDMTFVRQAPVISNPS
jgi:putative NADH-flavin reductase